MTIAEHLRPSDWLRPDGGPRYTQLRNRLRDAIRTGILTPNASLPPEREIAEITGLSRVTVRKAMQDLVDEGLVMQRQGSGSFVRETVAKVEQSLLNLTSFTEDMAQRGMQTTSLWLERGIVRASPREIEVLGLMPGASVARVYRLRAADGRPLALERATLPLDILPNPLVVETSLYAVLSRDGHRPARAVQRFTALNLGPEEAELLHVAPGTAALGIERTSFLDSGQVVEFTRSIYRGDAYDFVAELGHPTR
ncbi:MAG: GntR family transcriptional regulator [Alphaproteobacteria bacterium]|nr:GntR family transcriptional regulator [Alphaproteobacteria bacterium]